MRLDDFYHLPVLAEAFARLQAERPDLVLVAGLDLPPRGEDAPDELLPSGRTTIFRVLAEAMLTAAEERAAVIAAEGGLLRLSRAVRQRVALLRVQRGRGYAFRIAEARAGGARLLILDQLSAEAIEPVARAVAAGARVLTQLNSAARGMTLLRELEGLGLAAEQLPASTWLVAVRRLATLCADCRRPTELTGLQRLQLSLAHDSGLSPDDIYFTAPGCAQCQWRGRSGTVALFDLACLSRDNDGRLELTAILPMEQYARELALRGDLAFEDAIELDAAQARRIFQQFTAGAAALSASNQTLERKLAELRAANEVLEQRTAALLSLQTIGQALISSNDLGDLAHRVCRHVGELCGAERCALYLLDDDRATILAVSGWDAGYLGVEVDGAALRTETSEPSPHHGWPPGIPEQHADVAGVALRAGLCVPLIAEGRQLGMLIIHSIRRPRFEPSEVALLQTFAHQAALSIQRTRLIDQLQDHIVQLQAAQAALVEQQRLAREMELAAEVQRSILPHVFPALPGLSFAAENRPAQQVGGDFYDVFMLDETTVGLVIADVSGKGMPAALYMALTRSLLLAEARRERSPRAVLLNVNRLLREVGDPQMFVTVFYGVIAAPSRRLTFARAGHDYPLLFRSSGTVEQLVGKGTVLGMLDLEPEQLTEERLQLGSGDRLVLYTDGLTDVFNEAGERLELPRLQAILEEQRAKTPEEICANSFAALNTFRGAAEQFDDMTIVVVGVD